MLLHGGSPRVVSSILQFFISIVHAHVVSWPNDVSYFFLAWFFVCGVLLSFCSLCFLPWPRAIALLSYDKFPLKNKVVSWFPYKFSDIKLKLIFQPLHQFNKRLILLWQLFNFSLFNWCERNILFDLKTIEEQLKKQVYIIFYSNLFEN